MNVQEMGKYFLTISSRLLRCNFMLWISNLISTKSEKNHNTYLTRDLNVIINKLDLIIQKLIESRIYRRISLEKCLSSFYCSHARIHGFQNSWRLEVYAIIEEPSFPRDVSASKEFDFLEFKEFKMLINFCPLN